MSAPGSQAGPGGTAEPRPRALRELAFLFLKLGATAFGGPAAHIAMMEDEVVRRRRWMTKEELLDLIAAANLIPGPNSTELAIHIGLRRAGFRGLLVAGASFILPAALITLALAVAYVRLGTLPAAGGFLHGVKAAVLAVVVQALLRLGRTGLKAAVPIALAAGAALATVLGLHELLVLAIAGFAGALLARRPPRRPDDDPAPPPAARTAPVLLPAFALNGGAAAASAVATASTTTAPLAPLFLFFLKIGSVLFGSGYVLLAFIRADLVERWRWLTEQQLLDAVAVGQVTPGPVFTTATFIGYVLAGVPGAALATLGIFLPAFLFVALSAPLVPRLRRSFRAAGFLDGVVAASLALMAVVTFDLARAALVDLPAILLFLTSALLLIRYRVNSAWLVLGAGAVGFGLSTWW